MVSMGKCHNFIALCMFILVHVPVSWCSVSSSVEQENSAYSHISVENSNKSILSRKMTFEVTLHGLLLWVSMGFLLPIGTLIIKMSNREENGARLRVYFYVHVIVQMLAVLLATAGAIMSIKTFENSFSNNHQRVGLALYLAIWVQAMLGFCRPLKGSRKRRSWFLLHWMFGTIVCVIGIVNVYLGLEAYYKRTRRSVTLWTVLFTAQIFSMAFFYLLQDKWEYMKKQGLILEEVGQVRPSDQVSEQGVGSNDLWREPCSKSNALRNLFK